MGWFWPSKTEIVMLGPAGEAPACDAIAHNSTAMKAVRKSTFFPQTFFVR
jgi:hypothetical protein